MISTIPPVSTVPTGWDHGEHHRKPKLPIAVPDGQAILHAHLARTALDDERYRQRLAINHHQMLATLHSSLAAQKKVQSDLSQQREDQRRQDKVSARAPAHSYIYKYPPA